MCEIVFSLKNTDNYDQWNILNFQKNEFQGGNSLNNNKTMTKKKLLELLADWTHSHGCFERSYRYVGLRLKVGQMQKSKNTKIDIE